MFWKSYGMGHLWTLGVLLFYETVHCEYCQPYTDLNNNLRSGFGCPEHIRLVGRSDVYCCVIDESTGERGCCNDRLKSLYHSSMTNEQEELLLYWPVLFLVGLVAAFAIVIPYTLPREAEVKHDIPMD